MDNIVLNRPFSARAAQKRDASLLRAARALNGVSDNEISRHESCHINIFKLSPSRLFTPSAADGS